MCSGKIEVEVEIKSPANKFWESIRDSIVLFPKIFPEQYKSIEVLEGDGKSVGSIKLLKYAQGVPIVTFSKEKIEAVDEANKSITYSMIDGELENFYKNFKANLHVAAKGEDDQLGSLVKWSCEFEKATGEVPDPDTIKDFAVKSFQELDAYLLKQRIKSSADKFWGAISDSTDLFPKIFPTEYKSIEILEGDGKSVGSIRLLKYAEGIPIVTFSKEKIEVADETNKTLAYSVIDGELATFYKSFKATLQVVPKGDGSLAKWSVEYEKASEEVPEPNLIQEFAVKTFHDLDAYLLKA